MTELASAVECGKLISDSCDKCPFVDAAQSVVYPLANTEFHVPPELDAIHASEYDLARRVIQRGGVESLSAFNLKEDGACSGHRRKWMIAGRYVCGSINLRGGSVIDRAVLGVRVTTESLRERARVRANELDFRAMHEPYAAGLGLREKFYKLGAKTLRSLTSN